MSLVGPRTHRSMHDGLSAAEAEAYVHGICFKTGPPRRVGIELEWLIHDANDPAVPVAPARLLGTFADLEQLATTAPLTREPGGQVELSSLPADSLVECVDTVQDDLATLRDVLRTRGLTTSGYGHDPWHPPRRVLDLPRYRAMEHFFDRAGPAGRAMMCSSASVQVCLDAGTERPGAQGYARRWRLAHLLGPVLIAAFANSPLLSGRPSGWRSTRQAVWMLIDPSRTLAPPQPAADGEGPDPRDAWASYALDAAVMCVRRPPGRPWTAPAGLTFRDWIGGAGERPPTAEDLAYHLTTLFPPVRPQGHLELRMIDAQPGDDGWVVPFAVVTALFADHAAADAAAAAAEPLAEPGTAPPRNAAWRRAARHGLADPALQRAALACFTAVDAALPRLGAPPRVRAAVADYAERHVLRGRCPADDLLDAVQGTARKENRRC